MGCRRGRRDQETGDSFFPEDVRTQCIPNRQGTPGVTEDVYSNSNPPGKCREPLSLSALAPHVLRCREQSGATLMLSPLQGGQYYIWNWDCKVKISTYVSYASSALPWRTSGFRQLCLLSIWPSLLSTPQHNVPNGGSNHNRTRGRKEMRTKLNVIKSLKLLPQYFSLS